ncbi:MULTISPECIES: hypothetical protein [Rhizobium]|uniref:Uncharacterized protein n=1 Tax=Rhizobium tropici TaxID=398 RepID=A0ABR6QSZ5_RHITR|nr:MULTISPECIES: hypothetical protein [Rhizobium]MBB4239469.1 hypothetical protein [Rhizobium tropici]MBB5590739.1 hypothetical protein [Rhizobium tropici]MBB6490052.1 hypothetical protein [Rhizobium tropici]
MSSGPRIVAAELHDNRDVTAKLQVVAEAKEYLPGAASGYSA